MRRALAAVWRRSEAFVPFSRTRMPREGLREASPWRWGAVECDSRFESSQFENRSVGIELGGRKAVFFFITL